jgi:hypothetical protein
MTDAGLGRWTSLTYNPADGTWTDGFDTGDRIVHHVRLDSTAAGNSATSMRGVLSGTNTGSGLPPRPTMNH